MPHWLIWICCAVVLLVAGFVATARTRRTTHHRQLAAEVASARRAIDLAEASRDTAGATPGPSPADDPQQILDEAVGLLADAPDVATARRARGLAQQADALWRSGTRLGDQR